MKKKIILSIGGSLVVPDDIDVGFLTNLDRFIRNQIKKDIQFFLVIGGGKITRYYQQAAKKVAGHLNEEDIDWLGVHATRLNGHLIRTIFDDIAHPRIIENYDHKLDNWTEDVVVGAGWKPGWSTDYCAVMLAKDYDIHLIVNLTNIDYVYDKDPHKYKDAQPIKHMSWDQLQNLVGDRWVPGSNTPFDPVATKKAKDLDLSLIIASGSDFDNLTNIVEGREFVGTIVAS